MKSTLLTLTFLAALSQAAAAQADCKTLRMVGTHLSYTTVGEFPATPMQKKFEFLDEDAPASAQKACGMTFTPDRKAGAVKISAPTFGTFKPLFGRLAPAGSTRLAISNIVSSRGSYSPDEQALYFDPQKRTLSYKADSIASLDKLVVAVKIDGGPLKPLYYNGKNTPITYPTGAKKIDVYLSVDKGYMAFWERVTLDLKSPSITIFEDATLPTK